MSKQQSEVPDAFRARILVRFADCDPAGIVFYPRYLEMVNAFVEDWCREGLKLSMNELISVRRWGLPTVHLNIDFFGPSRMGERLCASLGVHRLGRSSIHLEVVFKGPDGSDRMRARIVLVLTELDAHRARPIPEDLRARIAAYCIPTPEKDLHASSATTTLGAP